MTINTSWMDDGKCRGEDPGLFTSEIAENIAYAQVICSECPVIGACARWASEEGVEFGVWGGQWLGKRPRNGQPWTEDEVKQLHELLAANWSYAAIGRKLGRSKNSVRGAAVTHGVAREAVAA